MCASDDTAGTARGELLIENDKVKVWRWSFDKRGDNTGWRRHGHDYVVIPLFDGVLDIDVGAAEPVLAELKAGVPYFRELGVEHDVRNGSDFRFSTCVCRGRGSLNGAGRLRRRLAGSAPAVTLCCSAAFPLESRDWVSHVDIVSRAPKTRLANDREEDVRS